MPAAPVRIGVLAPLTPPGWAEAGRHLLAGCEHAARETNRSRRAGDRPLELLVHDTAGDPHRAAAAVDELSRSGADAVVGEFHSVCAKAAAERADQLGIPFVCSSAVLDDLVSRPSDWVARLAPPQSRGWRRYAEYLFDAGHRRIAVVRAPGEYWATGTRILARHLPAVIDLDAEAHGPTAVGDLAIRERASALLLLVGHPEPAVGLVRGVRADPRLHRVLIGAPAGQPELADWADLLGPDGTGIPFLRYLPDDLDASGRRVESGLAHLLGEPASFVAFEGHDAVLVAAATVERVPRARWPRWAELRVEGSRGTIRLSRPAANGPWQWEQAPIQIADRDPADPASVRVLA